MIPAAVLILVVIAADRPGHGLLYVAGLAGAAWALDRIADRARGSR